MLTWPVIKDGLLYLLSGKLRLSQGHLPQPQHTVPADFFGVGVASNADPATDAYLIRQLQTLAIRQVRLDLSGDDLIDHQGRFCEALLQANFAVTLRLIPSFESAQLMHTPAEQAHWQAFVDTVLTRFGSRIQQLEICNTPNRRRWAGYTWAGFYAAWEIAFKAAQARGISMIGPNIQDFEPLYNVSVLKHLAKKQQLPAAHSNNLFVERVSEPERFDHRILKYRWAQMFKFNLIKKARLLQKIAADFGVQHTVSTGAFWAIYRIERILAQGAQKQADYLSRYFTLLAASGALKQAFWGTLVCHREGLIDDGLQDAEYPALERVARYQRCDGDVANYQPRPSFAAMQTVVANLAGAQYVEPLASGNGLEIHCFLQGARQLHVAWTMNGKAVPLSEVYSQNTLTSAHYQHRDGLDFIADTPDLITETPIYISWPLGAAIHTVNLQPKISLSLNKHQPDTHYFVSTLSDWRGVVAAKNHDEMLQIQAALHPQNLTPPTKQQSLRHARNAIWALPHPLVADAQITVKKPVKMYWHKQLLDYARPSKARRSWNGAMELLRRDIATPQPIAFFERVGDRSLKQNVYICAFEQADSHIGRIFSDFAAGKTHYHHLTDEQVYAQLARFIQKLHSRGCYFRDLSGGNILVSPQGDDLRFSLIDTARARFYDYGIPMRQRLADVARAVHKLNWAGRKRFLAHYLGLQAGQVSWRFMLPLYLYEAKVSAKRTIGRKGLKALKQKLFS